MTLHFNYEKNEVIKALRHHFIQKSEIKWLLILINLFAIISTALFFMGKISSDKLTIFSALWFVTMISVWLLLPNSIYKQTKTFNEEIVAQLNSDALVLNTHKGTNSIAWNSFSHYKEGEDFFYLYQNAKSFFLIPKSAAHTEASVPDMRTFFNTHIKTS
jgi:signal transduction histidine kinase